MKKIMLIAAIVCGNATIGSITGFTASKTGIAGAAGGKAAINDVPNSTTLYGIIITTYDSDKDGTVDLYAVNKAVGTVNDSGTATSPTYLAKYLYGQNGGTPVTWESAAKANQRPVRLPRAGLLTNQGEK